MEPQKSDDAVVELVDVLLEDGAVLAADALITVADVPLVGVRLRLMLAGMTEMADSGVFEEWDRERRRAAMTDGPAERSPTDGPNDDGED
jgi:hypothetical protein